jgi:AcrR family transcriptional regulator
VPVTARGQATRRRLLDAAEEVFGARGFERASIVDVTRGAEVAQGTFYVYFPDKQAIFTELVTQLGHDLRRHIAETVVGLDDRMAVERAGFRAFFQFIGATATCTASSARRSSSTRSCTAATTGGWRPGMRAGWRRPCAPARWRASTPRRLRTA